MGIKKFAATLAAVVMAFSCMAVSASAAETATYNNHDDTAFSFAFSNWGRSNTTGRSKTDTSGTFVIIVPLLTNFILSACFVPAFRPEPYADLYYGVPVTYLWSSLYVTHPLLYVLLYILLAGVMAGMWATVGVSLAFLVQNRFVVMILPYLLLLFFHVMWSHFAGSILNLQIQLSPFYFIIPRAIEYTNSGWVILVWIAVILLFDLLVYWRKGLCSDVL